MEISPTDRCSFSRNHLDVRTPDFPHIKVDSFYEQGRLCIFRLCNSPAVGLTPVVLSHLLPSHPRFPPSPLVVSSAAEGLPGRAAVRYHHAP